MNRYIDCAIAAGEDVSVAKTALEEETELPHIEFLPGDGTSVWLPVAYIGCDGIANNAKGECAYCENDPCGEGDPESRISKYMRENSDWAYSCPFCKSQS